MNSPKPTVDSISAHGVCSGFQNIRPHRRQNYLAPPKRRRMVASSRSLDERPVLPLDQGLAPSAEPFNVKSKGGIPQESRFFTIMMRRSIDLGESPYSACNHFESLVF